MWVEFVTFSACYLCFYRFDSIRKRPICTSLSILLSAFKSEEMLLFVADLRACNSSGNVSSRAGSSRSGVESAGAGSDAGPAPAAPTSDGAMGTPRGPWFRPDLEETGSARAEKLAAEVRAAQERAAERREETLLQENRAAAGAADTAAGERAATSRGPNDGTFLSSFTSLFLLLSLASTQAEQGSYSKSSRLPLNSVIFKFTCSLLKGMSTGRLRSF